MTLPLFLGLGSKILDMEKLLGEFTIFGDFATGTVALVFEEGEVTLTELVFMGIKKLVIN